MFKETGTFLNYSTSNKNNTIKAKKWIGNNKYSWMKISTYQSEHYFHDD